MEPQPTTPAPAVMPVVDLTQKEKDHELSKFRASGGSAFVQDLFDENLKNRTDLLDAQQDKFLGAMRGQRAIQDITGGYPVLGAFLWSMAKAARSQPGDTYQELYADGNGIDKVMTRFEKTVGMEMSKTINLAAAGEGGLLVEGDMLELWLEPLVAMSVVLGLRPRMIPVLGNEFGVNGWEILPTITWVEEENVLPLLTQPVEGERKSNMRKAMALLPITSEYREAASPAVFRHLEEMLREAFATGFDQKLINGSGLNNNIKGLRTLITATSASTGSAFPEVLDDIQTILTSVGESNIRPISRQAWIFSERTKWHLAIGLRTTNDDVPFFSKEMAAGTFFGFPFGATTNVPTNLGGGSDTVIIHQAMDQFLVGQGPSLDIMWFRNTSYTQDAILVSSMERDTEVLRGRQKIGTLMPRGNSGYLLTGVSY